MKIEDLKNNLIRLLKEEKLIQSKKVSIGTIGLTDKISNTFLSWDKLIVYEKELEAPRKEYKGFQANRTETINDNLIKHPLYYYYRYNLEGSILELKPENYLQRIAPENYEEMMEYIDKERANRYFLLMKKGKKFPTPFILYQQGIIMNEGRHRAYAAKLAGLGMIPVLVVNEV